MSISIGVQLTTRCNFDCVHCFVDGEGNDLPLDVIKKIIPAAKAHNCSCLDFTGGEPTLHPDFPEIVELLAQNHMTFSMITNGWNFTDQYRDIKAHLGAIRRVVFSLDGATQDVHDATRREGAYQRVLQAAGVCKYKEIPFGIRMTVTGKNMHQLEEMALLAAKIGAEELAVIPLQPTPRMAALDLLLSTEDLNGIAEHAARLRSIFKIKITLTMGYFDPDPLPLCPPMTMKQLFVTSMGKLGFCCHLSDYDGGVKETDIIGTLEEMSIFEAHQLMIDAVAAYRKDKIRRIVDGKFSSLDYFPCWYCLRYFRKVDWLAGYPGTQWADELIATEPCQPLTGLAAIQGK